MHFPYDTTATVISKLVSASARANILFGQCGDDCPPAPTAPAQWGQESARGRTTLIDARLAPEAAPDVIH